MADFRKLLFALVAVALFANVASAQLPYSCNATAVPTLVRSEGIAELTGDVLLTCSGVVPAQGIQANVRIALNTNITSNVLQTGPTITEAILLLDEGAPALRGPTATYQNIYQGQRISDTELEFLGVVLAAPGSAPAATIRITNVRGNASALGTAATIFARINITGSTTVPVNNNQLVVADTRKGMTFSVTGGSYKNCQPATSFTLKFMEGFAAAFRPRATVTITPDPNLTVGGTYPNESGYTPGTLAEGTLIGHALIGKANQGTRLMARLTDVPSGVTLKVPERVALTGTGALQLVTGASADGSGGTLTTGGTTALATVTNLIVYEVVDNTTTPFPLLSLATQETVSVSVTPSYTVPGPLGTAKVNGNLAPVSTVFVMDATAPEPRFADVAVDQTAFMVGPCRTILLFPFVTNQAGFDTGMAISNTSQDPLGTTAQAGACTLNYYGNSNGGAAPSAVTTDSIPAGGQLVGNLSSGGNFNLPAAPGFQGYIFAICNFQFAHGYAFISDLGAVKLAQGYLALIVPDRGGSGSRLPQDNSLDHDYNHGEQLGN